MKNAISPIDGRYRNRTEILSPYFSEEALIKYRILVEVKYFLALHEMGLPQLDGWDNNNSKILLEFAENINSEQVAEVKATEKVTNHDVKSIEYFIKHFFEQKGWDEFSEFIHFGLTSQDINNTAFPLMIQEAVEDVMLPELYDLIKKLEDTAKNWSDIPMLAHTHGQPASPTRMGKEIEVFIERLKNQVQQLTHIKLKAKFGGATGNFNAHYAAYPEINWVEFANNFCADHLNLDRAQNTTQIAHYDDYAELFHSFERINTILLDFCRDIWTYISMNYIKQRTIKEEVGSSAMPHKVNPIDFENAEGNIGVANALFNHLASKLPVSRLQRDLTDSTVLRNVGMPFAYTLISFTSIQKGLSKIEANEDKMFADLENNWAVVAEGIQVILRREKYPKPYEALKDLTRGKSYITKVDIHDFVDGLAISDEVKEELKELSPHNYLGI